ncbi:MAG: VUT family protein [Rhodospirillales bacterium]|nr:VUT family protein [Rhodospirillales bacterium]
MPFAYTILYIVLIVFVNWTFDAVPLVDLPGGEKWPPAAVITGLVFVARDFAQREIGHRVIVAMLLAGAISYVMAGPVVAAASVAAFLVSEFADWCIYSFSGRRFSERILISSAVSTPLDSLVFLYLIGAASAAGVALMTASKMVGAFAVWWLVRRRERIFAANI